MTTNGMTDVYLRIVHDDIPAPSGNGTHGRGIGAFKWLGGTFCFSRGGGGRLCTVMPPTNSALKSRVFASLLATTSTFLLRTMFFTNSSLLGIFCASLVAAAVAFQLRAMPDTNSALNGLIGAPIMAAAFHLRAMPDTNSGPVNCWAREIQTLLWCIHHGCSGSSLRHA